MWRKSAQVRWRALSNYWGLEDPTMRRQRRRRLKREFEFFQSLSQLFLPTYFVKCRWTLLELNSEGPYPSSKREIKFRRCLFMSWIKCEISHFHVGKRAKKCTKRVMQVRSCCFAYKNYCFFLRSPCRPRRWILKSLIRHDAYCPFTLSH